MGIRSIYGKLYQKTWEIFFFNSTLLLHLKYEEISYFMENIYSNWETGISLNKKSGKYCQNYQIS